MGFATAVGGLGDLLGDQGQGGTLRDTDRRESHLKVKKKGPRDRGARG